MNDKLQKLYNLYKDNGLITIDFNTFASANDNQRKRLYDLGIQKGLFSTTPYDTFDSAFSGIQPQQQPAQEDQGLVGNIKSQFLNQQPQQQPQRELPRMPKPGELANIGKEDENATFDSQGNYNPINALPESLRVVAKENKAREEAKKKEVLQSDLSAKQKAVESTAQQQADASLLASQSAAEAEALSPLLKNEFLRGVYQQLKDEETLPSFVKDQLSSITPEFIFLGEGSLKKQSLGVEQLGVEEAVVPKMNYMFGPLGFKFEETGAGDYMMVKAPNGEEIEISLNNRSMEKNRLESEKLKNFIAAKSAKIPQIEKYAAQYAGSDMRFNSEKQIDIQTKDISIQYDKLNKDAELLSNDIKKVESDLEYLNSAPANERNTPQYLEKKKATEAALLDVNTRRQEIISRNSQIEANKTNLDRAVGKYSAMKAEQGTWSGATVSFIGEGISTALSGLVNLALDFSSVDMTGDASQQRQAAIGKSVSDKVATGNVEEDAKQGGYVVDATIRLNNYNRSKGRDIIPEPKQGQSYKDWYNSLSAEQQNAIRVKIEDDITKRSKEIVLPAVREGIQGAITDPNTSVEWKQLAEEGFWGGAYAGLIKSAPAMLAPGGWAGRTAAFFGQSNDAVNEEMSKNPAFADVPESEKLLVSIPIGIANAVLEEVGLSNMIKNKGFVNSLVLKGLQKAGVNATETTLSKIIKNDVESMVARGALTLAGAGLAEAETGAGQQIAEYAVKDIYNLAKEKEMFDTPDSLKEYVYDVVRSGAQEAVGGFVMGTPSAAAAAFRKQGFKGMSDEQFETFEAIANDEKMQSSFIATLKTKVAAGDMTMAEAKEELNDYRNSVGLYRSIPTDLSTEAKKEAMNLVREKQVIEERIKDKDEALVKKQKDRIAEINVQLNNLSENAVQEQTTSEVPIQSETAVSEEVAGGKPTAESQVTTEEGKEEVTTEVESQDKKLNDFYNAKGEGYNPQDEVLLTAKLQAKKELEAEAEEEAKRKKTLFNRNPKVTPPTAEQISQRADEIAKNIVENSQAPSNTDEVLYSVHDLLDGFGRKYGNAGNDHGVRDDRNTWRDGKFFYQVKYNGKGQKYISVISPNIDNGGQEGNVRPGVATVMSFTLPDNVSAEKVGEAAIAKAKEIYENGRKNNKVTSKMLIDGVLPVVRDQFTNAPTTETAPTTEVTPAAEVTATEKVVSDIDTELKTINESIGRVKQDFNQEEDDRTLSELADKVAEAKRNLSKAEDTDAAVNELKKAEKEKSDFEESLTKRKDFNVVDNLIYDEIENSKKDTYEYKDLFEQDPRLAALQSAKDMIEFAKENPDTEVDIAMYENDIKLLEEDIAKFPVKTAKVAPADKKKSVDLSIAEGAVERTTKILERDGADIAAIDADQELDAAFEAYNELLKTDDGTLKGAAKAKLTKAERKFRKLAEAKGVKDYELIAYKRAKKELAAQTAVEVVPVVEAVPVAEVTPVFGSEAWKQKEETNRKKIIEFNKNAKENRGENINIKDYKRTKKRGQDLKIGDVYVRKILGTNYVFKVLSKLTKHTGQFYWMEVEVLHIGNDYVRQELDPNNDIREVGRKVGDTAVDSFKNMASGTGKLNFGEVTVLENFEAAPEAKTEAAPEAAPAVKEAPVAAPAPKAEPAPTPAPAPAKTAKEIKALKELDDEIKSLEKDIDNHVFKIEDLENDIVTERDNKKEGVAEFKEQIAEVKKKISERKKSGIPKETIKVLVEELEVELDELEAKLFQFREDQDDYVESYKEDIAQEKADMKKAQKRLDKLIAKREQMTQPEAAPKKPGIISMAEIEKRFPLAAEFIKAQYGNVPEVTSKSSLDVLVEAYDQLMRYKVGAEKRLLQIEEIENLVESLEQSVKKVSKEEFKKQIAASGDFTKAQLKIFNALVDSLQTETMPEYMSDEQAAKYNAGTENFYVASLNRIVSKQAEAFMHEIGHFGFFKILSKEDRLKYYQYMIDSNYGKGKPSLASRMAITVDTLLGRSAEGQEFRFRSNAADNFSEYFAQQFSEWYMSERLFPKEIDTIFSKVAKFFNLFIEKLKSGKYVDQNLSEYFNKISAKIEKQQKKNQKIQEELGIEETMMNELQDLEDFFGIDPAISPMNMQYATPLQKMALMYNMTESGFFPKNVSTSHVNRDFAQFNLEAKQSASGSYYLVDKDTKKMARPLRQPKGPGTIPIQALRSAVTPISVKDMDMEDVIDTARENGFSDDTIKALLIKRGYDPKEVDSALTFNVNFASAYTNNNPTKDSPLPQAFRTIDGGVSDGIKLFFDVRNKLIDFAQTTKKKGMKAGKRVRTYAEIRAKAIELLEANPIFQAQTDTKQKELIAAFDKTLNIKRGKLVSAQIAEIRKALKERLVGMKDLKKAQLILRNFIRQSLPAVKVPRVFFTLDGLTSPAEGINYYNNLRKQIYDFARTDASGVVGKKILVKDAEKIKEFTIKLLKGTELYKNQSPEVQADMENAIINSQYTKGESHTLDIYSQKEVNKLIDIVSQTDSKNLLAQAEKVFDIITEQRAKIKNGLLKEMLILVNKKATSKKTSSGKVRSNGLDAQGQAFYKSIKPIIVAAIKNDTDAMIEIATELSDVEAIQDALDKESAGEELTTLERDLLDKVYAFDTFADILNMELEEVQDLLDGLKGVRSASIVRLNEKRADRVAQREAMTAAADEQIKKDYKALYDSKGKLKDKNDLNDDRAMIWQSFKDGKVWSALTQWLERYDFFTTKITDFFRKTLAHLGTISNILDKSGTFFTDNVYRPLNRMDEVSKTTYSNEMKNLDDLANSIDGVTKGYRQIRRLIESTGVVKMVINGKTSPKNGDQLLRIYALSLNEVQREKLRKMGYTDQKIEEIKKILGPQAIEFADKLVDYFSNEYYESINEVYSFVNDVNLGYVENYFPTQTLSKSKEQQDAFDENLLNGNFNGIFDAESSPALKERTDMSNPIDLSPSFTNVIESHLQTMERYKAYAEGVKKLNDLFKIQSVNTLLDQTGLKSTMKNLVNNSINPNAGVNETQARFGGIMNKFSGYALAFKLAQIPKQATAILAAYEDYQFLKNRKVPGLDAVMFAFDVAKTLTFARSNFNKFYNTSGNFRDRIIKGVEGDVYGLEAGGRVFKPLSQKANTLGDVKRFIKSSAASPTMVGDIISVYGYMANYNRDIANGMSPEAALEKFNNYNATLQSRRAADKSTLQFSKSGLVRAFSMFGSTGILQMNKVAMAYKNIIRSIRNKQVPSGKDLRALAINLGVANAAFVAASYVFALMKGDDEDKEMVEKKMFEALIGLNLLYQIPLVGTATEEVVNAIKNNANKSETLKDIFGAEFINNLKGEKVMGGDVTNPYSSVFRKIKKYYDDDNTIIENFRPAAELALGMQLDPFIGLYKGATEEFDDEVMYDILGISPSYRPKNASSLENMSKSELKKYKPDEYERLYGPGSEDYDEEQAKKEAKAAERKARKDAMDDYYNYESKDDNKRGGSRIGGRGGSRTGGSRTK